MIINGKDLENSLVNKKRWVTCRTFEKFQQNFEKRMATFEYLDFKRRSMRDKFVFIVTFNSI